VALASHLQNREACAWRAFAHGGRAEVAGNQGLVTAPRLTHWLEATLSAEYRVQLDVFTGPLDLLLYLIRRDELDIQDIPIARLTEQYLEYVKLLEVLDPNAAGDFLVMASTLVELKSRALLPTPPLEAEDEDDPRTVLVRQLLEYKRFKDAASALGSAADERRKRFVRRPADLPQELQGLELEEAQVWDLLTAFGRVMSAIGQGPGLHEVSFDDTPIEEYAILILDTLEREGPVEFQSLFVDRLNRAEIIGLFLALLELLRTQRLRAEQDTMHGAIYLFLLVEMPDLTERDHDDSEQPEHAPASILWAGENADSRHEISPETNDEHTE
jgi:segregation and condensation protein A